MTVDHAIVGAGLSGLLLARALLDGGPGGAPTVSPGERLLLVDPALPDPRPHTLAFWHRGPTTLGPWAIGSWRQLRLVGHDGSEQRVSMGDWRYTAVAWGEARAALLAQLAEDPRVEVRQEHVESVLDAPTGGVLRTPAGEVTGSFVYDSRPPTAAELATDLGRTPPWTETPMHQVFRGVWLHTHRPVIDVSAATLLDFAHDDGPDLGFSYVLPVSPNEAMVMAVRMGEQPTEPDPTPLAARLAGSSEWSLGAVERGATPLVGKRPTRRRGRHVLAIGKRGGRVRPSTGYAVPRILEDTARIVASLQTRGHPFDIPADPRWQARLDTIWLRALSRERAGLEPAFLALFARTGIERVLRFLDGDASAADVSAVVRALPKGPFVAAAGRPPRR